MDKDEYVNKIQDMLADQDTYDQLDRDPTPTFKRKLISMLSNLKKEGKLDEYSYRRLYRTSETIP